MRSFVELRLDQYTVGIHTGNLIVFFLRIFVNNEFTRYILKVVTIATYSFFIIGAVGRQYVDGAEKKSLQTEFDVYVPVFTIVEFLFFMGLLKVL